jgi:acyl-CoA synthetase (AMP-forming)/AMP-acid ligase II
MALSAAYGGDWVDSPLPVWQRLAKSANQHPAKLALASLHQPADLYGRKSLTDDHLQWSYAQLSSATDSFSSGLQAHGLTSESAIVTFLDNGVEFGLSVWAAHKLGCPFVPLNPRNLLNTIEARHMLAVADAAVIIVGSPESAAAFDKLAYRSERTLLKISAGGATLDGWVSFSELLPVDVNPNGETTPTNHDSNDMTVSSLLTENPHDADGTLVTILFTSGTTSLPKGCPHTNRTLNAFMKNLALGGCSSNDVFCGVLPNNHAMGYFYVLHFFCEGGSVVYPSPTFEAEKMAKALKAHSCSHACLVPTALHSLIDVAEQDGLTFPTLKDVCLAGASITPRNLRQVVDTLGSQAVSTGFGMTEGSPIWTAATPDPETLIAGDDTISGQASPGTYIKICASDSTQPLPRGQPGEVHESGPGVISCYIGKDAGSESFYTDGGHRWFKTGDRAIMHSDGRVSIVGRYKDMIIRGGENIAPAAIEAVLNRMPGVEAQVVAAADSIAGEVPVAILRRLPPSGNASISLQKEVRTSMGILYVPDQIMTLEDLGLDDFPRTMSGKVQKSTLRNLVTAFRKHHSSDPAQPERQVKSIEETVLHVWWRATGIAPGSLDKEAPTSNFADSITVMRVKDMYRKELGLTLSTREMADHESLQDHISVLQSKSGPGRRDSGYQPSVLASPLSLEDIQLVVGADNDAVAFKEAASSAVAKSGFDFDRDVAAVIQSSDFTDVMIKNKAMDTWNFGIAIVADGSTVPALEKALVAALEQSPLWPSFYVLGDNGSPFYVTMKPQKKLYDYCLTVCGSIPTLADLQQVAIQYPHREHATYPGILFHARLYHVEELGCAAFVMYLHHAVHDASSMRLVLEDLNTSLREPDQPLRPHLPYQTFADIYHSLRDSPRATLEVNWHVKRLADLHLHRKALYPPATVPRQATTANPDGWDYGFDAPQLLDLKRRHPHITASVVLKAAIALVSTTRTGHSHALFGNKEASRSTLPFWPTSLAHLSNTDGTSLADLDASDVAGPTMSAVTNLIPIHASESGLAFLTRVQIEQAELTKRSHAPWRRIMDKLDALHPGERAGDMLPEVHQTFFMTWVPDFLGSYENLRVAQIAIRAALGMVFVAGLGGPKATTYMISLRWDAANYSQVETERFVRDVERAVVWMLEEGNWEAHVGGFLDSCVK